MKVSLGAFTMAHHFKHCFLMFLNTEHVEEEKQIHIPCI